MRARRRPCGGPQNGCGFDIVRSFFIAHSSITRTYLILTPEQTAVSSKRRAFVVTRPRDPPNGASLTH
eukprot:5840697-Prymnesium_polylepis.1